MGYFSAIPEAGQRITKIESFACLSFPGKVCCWADLCLFGQLIILWKCLKYTGKMFKIQYEWIQNLTFRNPLKYEMVVVVKNQPTNQPFLEVTTVSPNYQTPSWPTMLTLPRYRDHHLSSLNFSGCIFSKPRAFGESSSESEGSDVGVPDSRVGKTTPRGSPEFTNMRIAGKWPWPKVKNGHIWRNVNVCFYCDSCRFFVFRG